MVDIVQSQIGHFMDQYSDTSDTAYITPELQALTMDVREKFELAIALVEMPPTMRERARLNLLESYITDGIEAVENVIEKAKDRRNRALTWLAKQN
jgi:hypothetical protein